MHCSALASASEEAEATSLSSACVHGGQYSMDDECSVGEDVGYEGGQK